MLREIILENFKCFGESKAFALSKINVFSGYNGRGKSTVLQSLLLIAQSFYKNESLKEILTKGEYCNLGLFKDLLNDVERGDFSFTFKGEKQGFEEVKLVFKEKRDRVGELSALFVGDKNYVDKHTSIAVEKVGERKETDGAFISNYPPEVHSYFNDIRYVSADRKGPTPFEVKDEVSFYNPVGVNGDHILNIIAGDKGLIPKISTILKEIMDGGDLDISGHSDKNTDILNLLFTCPKSEKSIKSINFGFGYTYILPIIVAAATMVKDKDGILIVENPEAHLHPKAQSILMKKLVLLAVENGIQLYVETHSEHVVNAIRLCVLEESYNISNKDVTIHFFDKDMTVKSLEIDESAGISEWPNGFFDQQERDLSKILMMGMSK